MTPELIWEAVWASIVLIFAFFFIRSMFVD
jgi:hypothetical protein